ncbi:IS701 family transposase [Streptomyces sp. NPDC126514]|uniref:IS701 family transposase n=1 Tax=Streptomyces sp. NPDC126514 TaxID=3155210 RepID=UPI00332C0D66
MTVIEIRAPGRTENWQVGTFLAYASTKGRALIDRELYLPASWTEDRCRDAGVPDEVLFATKTEHFKAMLLRAVEAGVPFAWVTVDEAYGQSKSLRWWMEQRAISHVMCVKTSDTVITRSASGRRVDELVAGLAPQAWKRLSAGKGSHGERMYQWARIPIRIWWENGHGHWVLTQRSLKDPTDLACYVCYGPIATRLKDLVRVAGARWAVEECFQTAKGDCGLDHYQVRLCHAWYRHITLAMAALAALTAVRAQELSKGEAVVA